MTDQTRMMIQTAAKCDATMTADERRAVAALLEGRRAGAEADPIGELLPVAEVARRLHKTPKTIHLYCKQGFLRKVQIGGNSRCSGIPAAEVARLLKGGAA